MPIIYSQFECGPNLPIKLENPSSLGLILQLDDYLNYLEMYSIHGQDKCNPSSFGSKHYKIC